MAEDLVVFFDVLELFPEPVAQTAAVGGGGGKREGAEGRGGGGEEGFGASAGLADCKEEAIRG